VKNEAKRIESIIQNIFQQTYRPIEILFIDGGSIDGTQEIIKALIKHYSSDDFQIRLLKEEDYGSLRSLPNARNIGIYNAKGKYIVFFDADFELIDNNMLLKIIEGLNKHEHVAITYIPNMHTWIEKNMALDSFSEYKKHLHILCGFRKNVFNKGLFDPNLGFREDFEFLQRIKTKYIIVETDVRRCFPHTFKEFRRQKLWYGRTALRYYKKRKYNIFDILIIFIKSNILLGLFVLSLLSAPFNILLSLLFLLLVLLFCCYKWFRIDFKVFGVASIKFIPERFIWWIFRATYGTFFFDLGLINSIFNKDKIEIGR
jgi:glycosyltransferase involved in cell wall biosynthesis